MTEAKEDDQFARLAQSIHPGSTLLRRWELKGGVSARVTGLELEQSDGQVKKVVVRQHGAMDLKQNPNVAADEFKLLQLLQSAGLATPKPYYLDQSGQIFATPYIVIEYIEGTSTFSPTPGDDHILQLATHLSRIHSVDCSKFDLSFLPKQENRCATALAERPANVAEASDEGRIRATLEAIWPVSPRNRAVLLHGDFWPGNTVWRDRRLVAVIDWEDAAWGDPLADVANGRLEILWAFDVEAMHSFTRHYQAMTAIDSKNLPPWELWAALRALSRLGGWNLDDGVEKTMRERLHVFISEAFKALSSPEER